MARYEGKFKYYVDGKEVATFEEFYKEKESGDYITLVDGVNVYLKSMKHEPFFLDEILNLFSHEKYIISEEQLEEILKKDMNIGEPNYWELDNTIGSVFEKVQESHTYDQNKLNEAFKNAEEHFKKKDLRWGKQIPGTNLKYGKIVTYGDQKVGKKESKTVEKPPVFTFCKQMKNAVEALALRSLYGHNKYEKGDDWENFSRVENGDFEYSNAEFRHALGIGKDENEEQHLIAGTWNAIARLELYLRKKNEKTQD